MAEEIQQRLHKRSPRKQREGHWVIRGPAASQVLEVCECARGVGIKHNAEFTVHEQRNDTEVYERMWYQTLGHRNVRGYEHLKSVKNPESPPMVES
jgi:hypothetical protein